MDLVRKKLILFFGFVFLVAVTILTAILLILKARNVRKVFADEFDGNVFLSVEDNEFTNESVTLSCFSIEDDDNNIYVDFSYAAAFRMDSMFPDDRAPIFNHINGTRTFLTEGNYILFVRSTGDYQTTKVYHFTIDTTAPVISCITDGAIIKHNLTVTWDTTVGGARKQLTNANDTLTVKYSRSINENFPTTATTICELGTELTQEGNYLITIEDRAGNMSSYRFTIDKTAPTLSLSGVTDGGITNSDVYASWNKTIGGVGAQLTSDNDDFYITYSRSTDGRFPTTAYYYIYNSGALFTEDGYYLMTIRDYAGNSSSYTFIIDKTAPTLMNASEFTNGIKYTNDSFVFSVTDYHFEKISVRGPNGESYDSDKTAVSISSNEKNFGEWQFRAYDAVGNSTEWYSVRLYVRNAFDNLEEIKNSYKISTWYTVTLPAKIYTDIAGTYSFSSYDAAYSFAMAKEWEYRVEELSGGRYSYVNIANESIAQVYSSLAELEPVMKKYASSYVSDRRALAPNGSIVPNPTDEDGVTRADALTSQNLILPSALSEYSNLPLYFAKHSYSFVSPNKGVVGNNAFGSIQFIYNGISKQEGTIVPIEYGQTLEDVLKAAGSWYHGYYHGVEQDLCGNIEEYLIFIDTQKPVLQTTVMTGVGESESIVFDETFVSQNANLLRFLSISLDTISDAMDEFSMLYINGRNLSGKTYAQGDELPCLNYENGYWGSYEVIVYDRSLNCLSFTLRIAGEEISVSHTSLTSETRCTLTVVNNDSNNAIVSITLLKVSYTGEEISLDTDDDETSVSPENLVYVLRTGGKYIIRITDIYGRTSETGPLFYMKGLPSGILSGVKEGGITKSDVKFSYSANCGVILYVWEDNQWLETDDIMSVSSGENTAVASIGASASTSRLFKFFLYQTEDMNLFTEYQFEIDCIPPSISAYTESGNDVQLNSVMKYNFYLNWDEANVSIYYYRQENPLGSLVTASYTKEEVISLYGTYVFEARDAIGNVSAFTITLDNVVSYTLEGNYSELEDGSYISKSSVTLTITEKTSSFVCTSSNGVSVANGQALTIDGTYIFSICDLYGNNLEITVIIDVLPPVPIITTVDGLQLAANSSTNQAFTVSCDEENVQISMAVGSGSASSYTGELISDEGFYTFRMYDRVNNLYEFTITLDQNIEYSIGGSGTFIYEGNHTYLSKGNISLILKEGYRSFEVTSEHGNTFTPGEVIKKEDVYTVHVCDSVGNELTFCFIIDQTAPMPSITSIEGGALELNSSTNQSFVVSCAEEGAVIEWKMKDENFSAYAGEECSDAGSYYFRLTDRIGNSVTFWMTIDRNVFYALSGTYTEYAKHTYASRTWLKLNLSEDYVIFEVTSEHGNTFAPGDTIRTEDVYTVYIRDSVGNDVQLTLIIDFTPPKIELFSDSELNANGATRGNVTVTVSDYLFATYTLNGHVEEFTDSVVVDSEGHYTVTAKDHAGNSVTRTFSIDRSVDFTASRELMPGQFITDAINFTFNEPMGEIILTANGEFIAFKGGTIRDTAKYLLTANDALGNSISFDFEIIPAAARGYELVVPGDSVVTALLNGGAVNVLDGDVLRLNRDGRYVLEFDGANGSYTLNLIVDTVIPTAEITKSGNQIVIDNVSKENVTLELYRNGKLVNYTLGKAITGKGNYRIVLTDALGNTNSYEVSLNYVNAAGIICIVIACIVVIGALLVMFLARKRQSVR